MVAMSAHLLGCIAEIHSRFEEVEQERREVQGGELACRVAYVRLELGQLAHSPRYRLEQLIRRLCCPGLHGALLAAPRSCRLAACLHTPAQPLVPLLAKCPQLALLPKCPKLAMCTQLALLAKLPQLPGLNVRLLLSARGGRTRNGGWGEGEVARIGRSDVVRVKVLFHQLHVLRMQLQHPIEETFLMYEFMGRKQGDNANHVE